MEFIELYGVLQESGSHAHHPIIRKAYCKPKFTKILFWFNWNMYEKQQGSSKTWKFNKNSKNFWKTSSVPRKTRKNMKIHQNTKNRKIIFYWKKNFLFCQNTQLLAQKTGEHVLQNLNSIFWGKFNYTFSRCLFYI